MVCRLLSECDEVIALNEPMQPEMFPTRQGSLKEIDQAFNRFRSSLLRHGLAPARISNGKITDNAYSEGAGPRQRVVTREQIQFDKSLSSDFILCMKHCAEFTLLIPELKEIYPVFAFIRNPLALLSSWASVNVPVSRGKVSKAARLNPEFDQAIQQHATLLDKQLFILDWYFGMFLDLPDSHILKYEDVIKTNGKLLSGITGKPVPEWQLQGRNTNQLYTLDTMRATADALLSRAGNWNRFYSDSDIELLLERNLTK